MVLFRRYCKIRNRNCVAAKAMSIIKLKTAQMYRNDLGIVTSQTGRDKFCIRLFNYKSMIKLYKHKIVYRIASVIHYRLTRSLNSSSLLLHVTYLKEILEAAKSL